MPLSEIPLLRETIPAGAVFVYWRCASCHKLLGQYDGTVLVILHGKLSAAVTLPVRRRCERCGAWNQLVAEG